MKIGICDFLKISKKCFLFGISVLLSFNPLNASEKLFSSDDRASKAEGKFLKLEASKGGCKRPRQGPPGPVLGNYVYAFSGFPFQSISAVSTFTPLIFDFATPIDGWVVSPTPIPADASTGHTFQNPNSGIYQVTLSAQAQVPASAIFQLGVANLTTGDFIRGGNGGMITDATTSGVFLLTEVFLMSYTANDVLQFQMSCDQLPSGVFKIQPPSTGGNFCVSVTIIRIQ